VIPVEPAAWQQACAGSPLKTGTLEIWRAPVGLGAEMNETNGLKPEECLRAERMLNPARRMQYTAGHALLHGVRAKHGMPLFTSLSHSGEWIVAAAARRGPVGVDVEFLRPNRPLERLSRRFFAPEEHAWLMRSPEEDWVRLFYRLWTAKEALFKALGMPASAAHFAARPVIAPEGDSAFSEVPIVEGCRVGWFSAAPGYVGAYAASADVLQVRYLYPA
jgi:4'-phosphopantetheinyl transferase